MTTLSLLPLALSLFLGGDHAALHPADATVYLSVPDVPAARAAYERSAIVRLLRDPEWNQFAARSNDEDPDTFRLDARACTLLEDELLVPLLGEAARGHAAVTDGLRSLSISLRVPPATPGAGAVEENLGDAEAGAPDSEGAAAPATPDVFPSAALGALLVFDHDTADGARAGVALVADALGLEAETVQHEPRPITLFGHEGLVQRWRAPQSSAWPTTWSAVCGTSAVVGVGAMTPDRWRALAESPAQRLSTHERFVQGDVPAPTEDSVALTDFHLDVRDLSELARGLETTALGAYVAQARPVLAEFFPGDALRGRWTSWADAEGVFHTASRTGLGVRAPAFGARPLPREALERLPAETMYAWAAGADFPAAEERVVAVLAALLDTDAEGARAFLAEEVGVDLQADLLAALGDHASAFVRPFSGPAVPECGLVLDLDDRDAFVAALDAIADAVRTRAGDDVDLVVRPYRGQPTYSFFGPRSVAELVGGNLGLLGQALGSLRPGISIGVLEDRVVLTIDRRYLTRELRRVLSEAREDADAANADATAGDASPRNALATAALPDDATAASSTDWPVALGSAYETVTTLLEMLGGAFGGSAPRGLPEAEALARHFRPSLTWSRTTGSATVGRCEGPFGPEFALGIVWLALQLAPAAPSVQAPAAVAEPTRPLPPQSDGAESADERTAIAAEALIVALADHHARTGALPVQLAQLAEPRPDGSGPSVTALPLDGWGNAFRYARDADGNGYRLWSTGPNGVDEDGRGDDRRFR